MSREEEAKRRRRARAAARKPATPPASSILDSNPVGSPEKRGLPTGNGMVVSGMAAAGKAMVPTTGWGEDPRPVPRQSPGLQSPGLQSTGLLGPAVASPAIFSPDRTFAVVGLLDDACRNKRACPHHDEAMIALVGADLWRDYLERSGSCAVADARGGDGDGERSRLLHDPVFQPLPVRWSEGGLRAKYAGLPRPPTPAEILDRLHGPLWPYRVGPDELARLRALHVSSDPGSSLAIWPVGLRGASGPAEAGFSPYPARQPTLPDPAGMGAWDAAGAACRVPPDAWGATGLPVMLDADTVLSPDGRAPRDPLAVLARLAAMAAVDAAVDVGLGTIPDPGAISDPLHAARMPGHADLGEAMRDQASRDQASRDQASVEGGSGLGPCLFASMAAAVAALWMRAAAKTAEADRLAATLFLRREAELDLLPAGAAWLHRRGERLFGEAPSILGDGLNGAAFDPLAAFPMVAGAFPGLAGARTSDYHEAWALLRREAFAGVALAAHRFGVTPGEGKRRSWSFGETGGHDGDAARELMAHWIAGVGRAPPGRDPGVGEAGLGLLEGRPPARVVPRAWGVAAFDPAWGGSPPRRLRDERRRRLRRPVRAGRADPDDRRHAPGRATVREPGWDMARRGIAGGRGRPGSRARSPRAVRRRPARRQPGTV